MHFECSRKSAHCHAWLACVVLAGTLVVWSNPGTCQQVVLDLSYGSSSEQRLDLSLPSGTGFTTVIFVHGGSLVEGDKADADYGSVCHPFVDAGIACANVNYRLAPKWAWPTQADDVAAAVAWVARTITARGGDRLKLFLFGHSSGAKLVSLVGTDPRYFARHGVSASDVRGVIAMGSTMWDEDLERAIAAYGRTRVEETFARRGDGDIYESLKSYRDSWPVRHLRSGLPPFLFLIAEGEQEHPPVLMTNREFVAEAIQLGNHAELTVLPGRTHMSAIRRFHQPGDQVFALVRDFIRKWSDIGG